VAPPPDTSPHQLARRRLLQLGLASAAGAALGACGQPAPNGSGSAKVLVAYFSRAGENYHYGNRTWLKVGNTEVVAHMIAELIDCDLHKIEATEPYSSDYDQTVNRNVREQNTTPTRARRSPTRCPTSRRTTSFCSAARSGTSAPR
jgi:hypothetical protein